MGADPRWHATSKVCQGRPMWLGSAWMPRGAEGDRGDAELTSALLAGQHGAHVHGDALEHPNMLR